MTRPKSNSDEQYDREIAFHIDQLTRENLTHGLSAAQARRQAILQFGGPEQVKQSIREVHLSAFAETLFANLRSGVRFIRRTPSFAAAIILTLALGIGANSAVFSAVDAILLRPLPFPHSNELVRIHQRDLAGKSPETFVSTQRLEDLNRLNSTFQTITGYYLGEATITSGTLPEKSSVAFVAPRFIQLWGVAPALGRGFTQEEERFGGPNALLVSDRFWRNHLHADPHAAGATVYLGDAAYTSKAAYTVVGVMPPSFLFPDRDVDLWEPNPVDAPYAQDRSSTWFTVVGRLKPGVSLPQAQADLATVGADLSRQFPKTDANLDLQLERLKSVVVGKAGESLWLLYASVSLLLLIACTNIAALLMARTAERQHEIAIRYSLGASRAAIIGQLLTEVFLLALAGSALGLLVAALASRAFTLFGQGVPRIDEITLNTRLLAYTLGCSFVVTLLCGLLPALRGTRRNLSTSLARASRNQVSTRSPWQWALVGVQVSLAVTMLIASGLLLRSFQKLGRVDLGFDPEHVLSFHVSASWGETVDMGKLNARIDRTLTALRSLPGVEAAATSASIPGNSTGFPTEFNIVDGTEAPGHNLLANVHSVSQGYFAVMHIPVLSGESCSSGLPFATAVVNRSFAQKYLAGAPALGYHLQQLPVSDFVKPAEVRGIVGDAHEEGIDLAAQPAVYWCYGAPNPDPVYLVRTHGSPAAISEAVRQRIHELEPGRSVFEVTPLIDHLDDRLAGNRLRTVLLTGFALTAIALVSVGLYGTISYLGRIRRREVGLRIALGALRHEIVARFVLQGLRVTLAGGIVGLLAAAALSQLLQGMLYNISPLDPATYAAVILLTLVVATVATLSPALRAAQVNPTEILRED